LIHIHNKSSGETIAQEAIAADTFWLRFKGLMFTENFPSCDGIIIEPCSGVHTFFMRYSIDVLLLNKVGVVIYKKETLKPNRFTPFTASAYRAVELPSKTLKDKKVDLGDEIIIIHH